MRKTIYFLLYILLFSPVLSYVYIVLLRLPKTILHFYVLIFFAFGLFFIINRKNIRFPKFLWLLAIYATYRLIWLFISDVSYHPLTFIYYSILHYSILFTVVMIYNTNFSSRFINRSFKIIKITVILAAIASIIQVFEHTFLYGWEYLGRELEGNLYTYRRTSIFGFTDQNEVGLSYIPLGAVLIGSLLLKRNKINLLYTILIGITAFLSNGRYIMIGFVILTIQYLIFYKIKILRTFKYILIVFISFFIIYQIILFLGYDMESWINQRLFTEGSIKETTRYKSIKTFATYFPQKPFFGTGVHLTNEIKEASEEIGSSQIHVGYLSHLVSYGLIGSFFLFSFWFSLARHFYKTAKKTNYWGSFFAFLIYFWAQVTLVNYSIFFYGLIFALVFDKYYQDLPLTRINYHFNIED